MVQVEDVVGIPAPLEGGKPRDLRVAVDQARLVGPDVAVLVRVAPQARVWLDTPPPPPHPFPVRIVERRVVPRGVRAEVEHGRPPRIRRRFLGYPADRAAQ